MKEPLVIGGIAEHERLADRGGLIKKTNEKGGTLLGLQVVCPHPVTILAAMVQHGIRSSFIGNRRTSARINISGVITMHP